MPKTVNHAVIGLKRCWNWYRERRPVRRREPVRQAAPCCTAKAGSGSSLTKSSRRSCATTQTPCFARFCTFCGIPQPGRGEVAPFLSIRTALFTAFLRKSLSGGADCDVDACYFRLCVAYASAANIKCGEGGIPPSLRLSDPQVYIIQSFTSNLRSAEDCQKTQKSDKAVRQGAKATRAT